MKTTTRGNPLRRRWPFGAALSAALSATVAAGCTGTLGDAPSNGSSTGSSTGSPTETTGPSSLDSPTKFTCDPAQKSAVDSLRARTTTQYRNTISDLASWAMKDPKGGPTLLGAVAESMASLPVNVPVVPQNDAQAAAIFPDGGFLRADQAQQFSRVQAYYKIGISVAQALTAPANLGQVVGDCATDNDASNDAACLTAFIQSFGARALGRPITPDDVAFYTSVYGADPTADPAAYADVVTVFLNSPELLYFVEHGDAPVSERPGAYSLSAYELAARLSYHVWDTLPDDELWQAAVDGSLLEETVYEGQVNRLFADPRAQETMHRFFEDYIQVNSTGGPRGTGGLNYHNLALRVTDPLFKAFAGADLPSASLERDMVSDAVDMLDYYTWTVPGTVHDLLASPLSFARSADVARIYGLPPWDGVSTPPSFPENQRPGLFTRALFLAAGADTAPILKGVYLRRYLLCDAIGRPPPQAANAMVVLSATQTTRQATEALTAVAPCSGCHTARINPLGFATEGFDGLGRFRTQQTLFNPDGTIAATLPVDTSVHPYVELADATSVAAGPADVMRLAEESNKPAACLSRNYFRYTFGRFEDPQADGCSLESMRAKLDGGGSLVDMLKAVVMTTAFKQRTFQ